MTNKVQSKKKVFYQGITVHIQPNMYTNAYLNALAAIFNKLKITQELKGKLNIAQRELPTTIKQHVDYIIQQAIDVNRTDDKPNYNNLTIFQDMSGITSNDIAKYTSVPKQYQEATIKLINVRGNDIVKINIPLFAEKEEQIGYLSSFALMVIHNLFENGEVINTKSLYVEPGHIFDVRNAETIYHKNL